MYKITIRGTAKTEYPNLERLHGIGCEDEFSEYFGTREKSLTDKGVCEGYMSFIYENKELWTITTYESPVELSPEELDILAKYTQGQWSDGIGEGFEQFPCMYDENQTGNGDCTCGECEDEVYCDESDDEVFISPWHTGQVLTIEQTKM